ncbi:hypothetical protein [uncultured Clostridium sp.]|uniref:hypothetical protein n=1 Tax=uncultured Clostridium sp. TaxID=59620 RepID=UPI0028E655E6|nr:hypothetical protein [uncultured Clostridium sp.]
MNKSNIDSIIRAWKTDDRKIFIDESNIENFIKDILSDVEKNQKEILEDKENHIRGLAANCDELEKQLNDAKRFSRHQAAMIKTLKEENENLKDETLKQDEYRQVIKTIAKLI